MSQPTGIDCALSAGAISGSCSARFAPGTVVTLQTEPGATSVFLAFGGDCALASCQTTMEAPRTVTATFVPNFLSIVANAGSVGGGRIVSSPAGIDCILSGVTPGTGACSTSFPLGTVVSLSQETIAGAVFQAWGTGCVGNPCIITVNGQRTVDVTYRLPSPVGSLVVSGFGAGTGAVTSSPEGINCTISAGVTSGTCSAPFAAGIAVTLTALSNAASLFTGFSGACEGTGCTATIVSGVTTTVGAGFSVASVPATLIVTPSPISRGRGTITSSPAGINCSLADGVATGVCSVSFANGTLVTLTQLAVGTSIFQGWSGDCVGNPCAVTMSQSRVAEVTYRVPPAGIIALSGSGTGSGTISSSPSGIACTITAGIGSGICSASFDPGTVVTLLAGALNGGSFDGFGGGCTGGTCSIATVSAVTTAVSVAFTAAAQRLTVAPGAGSTGTGVVSSTPAGISCVVSGSTSSGTCNALFAANTIVTLQQSASGNAVFTAWSGDCSANPCQVVLSQSRTALATFQTQSVSVSGGGTGNGVVTSVPAGISCTITAGASGGTCNATFPANSVVTLTATPLGLSSFSGYTGACSGTSCTVATVIGTSTVVTAQFAAPPTLTLAAATGSDGGGTLRSTPSGLTCALSNMAAAGTCALAFALNSTVSIVQTPSAGSVFVNWAGACTGSGSCSVSLSSSRAVQALYRVAVPGAVTVMAGTGGGNGTVSSSPGGLACSIVNGIKSGICRAIFPVGSSVMLIAVASSGFTFTGFSGSCSGMTCTMTVPENGDITVTANFSP